MQTRSQNNSQQIYAQIKELGLDDKACKLYGTLCHRFPIMVLRNGLAQTMGYLQAKGDTAHSSLHTHLCQHLNIGEQFFQEISIDLFEYQRLTREVLAAAIWYKRYAVSVLNVDAGVDAT